MPPLDVLNNRTDATAVPADLTDAERGRIARDLANEVEGEVRFGFHDRMLYATDASLFQVEPIGVVIPASVEDARRTVAFCAARRLPILPRGGGTSLAGQCTNRAVVIDFSARCRGIGEVDAERRRVFVEPGVVLDELNDELAEKGTGLFFGPDVATSKHAAIGGMVGNNSAGSRSIRYGRTADKLLAVDALVLDDPDRPARLRLERGAAAHDPRVRTITERVVDVVRRNERLIRERFPKITRRVDGYNLDMILDQLGSAPNGDLEGVNLASLVCGSEGTLGVTLGAELELSPVPIRKGLAVVGFASLDDALAALQTILTTAPTAVELLDDMVIDLARANREHRRYVELLPKPVSAPVKAVLYVEYSAEERPEEVEESFERLKSLLPGAPVAEYTGASEMAQAWKLRKAGEPLLHGVAGNRKPITFIEDTAVAPARLPEFVKEFRRIVESHGTKAAFYAHASVGCLHIRPLLDQHDKDDLERARDILEQVTDLVREYEGSLSGEHGDGRIRTPMLERFFGPELMEAFREIKGIFDPANLLNPGNIVEPVAREKILTRTRTHPGETIERAATFPDVDTYYDYSDQHGFRGALEMCNGAGVCRKKTGGTMCPSYMAMLDERHATRGRGNALRLAISGQLMPGRAGWNDSETMETLDLCLSCKACKAECPSNVDIARLKSEYIAQGHRDRGRTPLTTRVFGSVREINMLGSLTPGLANAMNANPFVRTIMEWLTGVDRRRSLPKMRKSLHRQLGARAQERGRTDKRKVVLFADCLTSHNEPEIGLSAHALLTRLGYEVLTPKVGCCARPKISLGLLEPAIREADALLAQLRTFVEDPDVEAILVMEPSCLASFADDYLLLKLRTDKALRNRLAEKAMLVEDFIEKRWEEHPAPIETAPTLDADVVLHGHCHQKALWGVETSAKLLGRLFADRLTTLDSGCCGMAGSFGYLKRRYDLSMRIGELVLFPEVRARTESLVAAPGSSCRHQIKDGTGRSAEHPVVIAARALLGMETEE